MLTEHEPGVFAVTDMHVQQKVGRFRRFLGSAGNHLAMAGAEMIN